MIARKSTEFIVIHCSATRAVQSSIGAKDIKSWHVQKGWSDIGYHFVIKRNGVIERGRDIDLVGAHVEGHNANSIGICLVGGLNDDTYKPENNFTPQQWDALEKLVSTLTKKYPAAKVLGHRDFAGVKKACPCFNAKPWAKKLGFRT